VATAVDLGVTEIIFAPGSSSGDPGSMSPIAHSSNLLRKLSLGIVAVSCARTRSLVPGQAIALKPVSIANCEEVWELPGRQKVA
jgi:hypothetical protein